MKTRRFPLLVPVALCAAFVGSSALAQTNLRYSPVGPNSHPGNSTTTVAPTSAGNVGPVFDSATKAFVPVQSSAPESVRLVLAQSSVGAAVVATPAGGASSAKEYLKFFTVSPDKPSPATFGNFTLELAKKASPWTAEKTGNNGTYTVKNIRFPGAVELLKGDIWDSSTQQNFYPEEYEIALEFLRTAIEAFPFDDQPRIAALDLLNSYMQGHIAAGNNAVYWAARKRFTLGLSQPAQGNKAELDMLSAALHLFKKSSDRFYSFLSTFPVDESTAFNAGRPWQPTTGNGTLQQKIGETLGIFARSLDLEEDVLSLQAKILYFNNYGDPVLKPEEFQKSIEDNVVKAINPGVGHIRALLATAGLFSGHPDFGAFGFHGVASTVDALANDLALSMPAGRVRMTGKSLFFKETENDVPLTVADMIALLISKPSDKFFAVGEYSPEFMPLIGESGKRSPEFLIEQAQQSIDRASKTEASAETALKSLLEDKKTVENRLNDTYTNSWNELSLLTGTIKGEDPLNPGSIVDLPDIEGAITGNASGGRIKAQLQSVELAFNEYEAAVTDLELAVQAIDITLEANAAVVSNLRELASFQKDNGTKLANLEIKKGAAQAAATRARARLQAELERRNARRSFAGGILSGAVSGALKGSWKEAAKGALQGAVDGLAQGANAFDTAKTIEAVGDVDARLAEEIANLNKESIDLQTDEKVEMTNVNANNTEIMAFAEIKKMTLDLTRKRLNVLLAEQRTNIQRTELANLYARASYLQSEMNRSIQRALTVNNPQWGSEYWLATAATIADAEMTYLWAQEWSYLAAKSLQYYILPLHSTTAGGKVGDVLRSRTAKALDREVGMGTGPSSVPTLYKTLINLRSSSKIPKVFRLRDHFVQSNPAPDEKGERLFGAVIDPATGEGVNSEFASNRHWMEFLKDCLVDDRGNKNPKGSILRIDFSTNLNRWGTNNGKIENPFYDRFTIGRIIDSASGKGVRANIRTNFIRFPDGIFVTLESRGTSTFRIANDSKTGTVPFRSWSTLPANEEFQADVDGNQRGALAINFREYSPANDHWILTINREDGSNRILIDAIKNYDTASANNETPPPIEDIELTFDTAASLL